MLESLGHSQRGRVFKVQVKIYTKKYDMKQAGCNETIQLNADK